MSEARVFLGLGLFSVAVAGLYWFTSYEDAGTTMLALAATLSFLTGGYLWLRARAPGAESDADDAEAAYFPHESIWPFAIGVAAFFVVNGLILGSWFLVPGGIALVVAVMGFAAQSRRRA